MNLACNAKTLSIKHSAKYNSLIYNAIDFNMPLGNGMWTFQYLMNPWLHLEIDIVLDMRFQ